jgi:hypothetical protein
MQIIHKDNYYNARYIVDIHRVEKICITIHLQEKSIVMDLYGYENMP